ncbi:dockerin type I repeat-containing protein [Lacipirellula parvula]|uniref:PEP-CTERM protein-sorting domain-containing protein n=1 Tax=Lacipirellula parvula TaxID=2650471 RepID=A0A5K7XAH1_9BACT|nr:dockerin type I repeat-containing protein [Lacipirellula parvula]BBO33710.1 hypothetical protein PLANPX_3322 [Lacipirellula parvula]
MTRRRYLSSILLGQGLALLFTVTAFAQPTPPAVLNTTDPALRLWLDASTLSTAGYLTGDPVTSWTDKSSYGTIMAPRTTTNPNGPGIGDPVEENPHFELVDIAGKMTPTVRFDRDGPPSQYGNPAVDGSGSTDRLYQTNNLKTQANPSAFDPLDIGDGSSLTTFLVYKPAVTTSLNSGGGPILGTQVVYGKRGTSSSVYMFGINNSPNNGYNTFVSYDGPVLYQSLTKPTEQVWHVTSMVITDNPGSSDVDTLQFFDAESMTPNQTLTEMGTQRQDGVPNNIINGRNASTPEPFGIGGHSQACCGEGETFGGNIAELIIFSKKLTAQEYADVGAYLSQKYFTPGASVPGDYNGDGSVNGDDLAVWKTQYGQALPAAPNADGTGDGVIDGADFLFWQRAMGGGAGVAAASAVPEPTSALLLVSAVSMLAWERRRRA